MADACRSCAAEIDWATGPPTEKKPEGAAMPVDHGSAGDPAGNIVVWRDPGTGLLLFRYLRKTGRCVCKPGLDRWDCAEHGDPAHRGTAPQPGEHRGISHWTTCPDAKTWRSE